MTYKITLDIPDDAATDFFNLTYIDSTTPAEVLEGFINDLVNGSRTRGSDERMYAQQYYDRCGYGRYITKTFARWLLREDSLTTVAEAMEEIKTYTGEIDFLKKHPEEATYPGELEELEEYCRNSREQIEELYKDYADQTTDPETMDKGLQGVSAYLEALEEMKGGI